MWNASVKVRHLLFLGLMVGVAGMAAAQVKAPVEASKAKDDFNFMMVAQNGTTKVYNYRDDTTMCSYLIVVASAGVAVTPLTSMNGGTTCLGDGTAASTAKRDHNISTIATALTMMAQRR